MTRDEQFAARRKIALGWANLCAVFLEEARAAIDKGYCECRACDDLIDAARQLCAAAEWLPFEEVQQS